MKQMKPLISSLTVLGILFCASQLIGSEKQKPSALVFNDEWPREWKVVYEHTLVIRYSDGEFSWDGMKIKEAEVAPYVSGLLKTKKFEDVLVMIDGNLKFREVVGVLDRLRGSKARMIGFQFER